MGHQLTAPPDGAPGWWRLAGLAVVAGAGAGAAAIALLLLVDGVTVLVTGTAEYGAGGRSSSGTMPWLGPLFLVGAPTLGGLGYGLLVHRFAPGTRGLGIPEVMLAIAGEGRVGLRPAAVRAAAAVLCLGTGGSLGREGPAVVAGSAIGSVLGRRAAVPVGSVRLLIGCGTAAATAAIFDAPATGVVFALELLLARALLADHAAADPAGVAAEVRGVAALAAPGTPGRRAAVPWSAVPVGVRSRSCRWGGRLRVPVGRRSSLPGGRRWSPARWWPRPRASWSPERCRSRGWCGRAAGVLSVFGPASALLAMSALVATVTRRWVLGVEPPIGPASVAPELAAAVGLGLVGGLVGAGFGALLPVAGDAVDRIWCGPSWLRPAVGGVLLGLLLLALPQLYGVGNVVVGQAVAGAFPFALLLALAAGKIVAASLTLAIGGVGGVFAPLLFVGATLGAAWGTAAGQVGGYALVGCAAVLAGAARVPVTAVVLVVELSGLVGLALPALAAAAAAAAAGRVVSPDTIYTRNLRCRGVHLGARR